MNDFKKILFPVDLSEASEKVVPVAITMVQKFEASLHLLHVTRLLEYFESSYVPHPSLDQFEKEIAQGAKKLLEKFRQIHFSDYTNVSLEVVTGRCADEILKYIKKNRMDLVIMGTHGRKGFDRMFFGSVARRVSQDSPIPVLLTNPFRSA